MGVRGKLGLGTLLQSLRKLALGWKLAARRSANEVSKPARKLLVHVSPWIYSSVASRLGFVFFHRSHTLRLEFELDTHSFHTSSPHQLNGKLNISPVAKSQRLRRSTHYLSDVQQFEGTLVCSIH